MAIEIRGLSSDPNSPDNIPFKAGPPLVGIILNWFLFGILIMQYFLYCMNVAQRDHKFLRTMVHFIFLLDIVQTIMTMVDAFDWFVYNFGNADMLANFEIAAIDSPFLDGIIAFTVQIVYCWRVHKLSGWKILPSTIAFLALAGGVNGIALGVIDRVIKTATNFKSGYLIPTMIWLWCSAATDILIASSMTYLLLKLRSERTSKTVLEVMRRLVMLTLETNLLTTTVAIAAAVMLLIKPIGLPFTNIHLACGYVLGKLYSNSFLVLLNQRVYYEGPSQHTRSKDLGLNGSNGSDQTAYASPGSGQTSSVDGKYPGKSSNTIGQVSVLQLSGNTAQVKLRPGESEDVELGQIKYGHV
ncbi:hypothetical protein BDZ94DRAFT_1265937 [Collybia nuda]|uniref:DUF6534 domain-containing protein n=1 Tax=Collybia nuda TaxID=64659 RepID=A0A9P5Y175_9AGAR|nr:hypothetical protein BDZ94DRAFT_1265937 [Collybia nuda]